MAGRKNKRAENSFNRRLFIKLSALSSALLLGRKETGGSAPPGIAGSIGSESEKMIRTACPAHNCGGRCLLKVHVKSGVIIRIETDDRPGDAISDPQLRACIRGRSYRARQYHPDRLKFPMRRTGKRGDGRFERITWEEAFKILHREISRVISRYGNSALFIPYGTGSYTNLNGRWPAVRLLNLLGGSLGYYNSYSWACTNIATPYVYGTLNTGNQRQDWINSKYIIMWGWNPAEMIDGTNSAWFIRKARENGARIVCIDPRMSMSAVALADEWIPIRPGTDTAMMSAMAWVIITEGLTDDDFIRRCCSGFDSTQMPPGCEKEESYRDYITGTVDGIPKTPEWAGKITLVPAETIRRIAREYAVCKPAVLYQGYGMQRRAYGEQTVRAGAALSAITGNIGIPGGWASGLASQDGGEPFWTVFPMGNNPVKARIPVFLWTEAILRGKEMGAVEGVRGADRLDNNIKLIWSVASNILVNQHSNINRTVKILRDEDLVEFIAVQDNFLTPSAMFADLVLPACTQFETWGVADGWKYGEEVFLAPKIADPPHETKSDYSICAGLAREFGLWDEFTAGGKDEKAWAEWIIDEIYRKTRFPEMPSFKDLVETNQGVYVKPVTRAVVALSDFRADPARNPLKTPTGKIELFSKPLFEMNMPEEIPATPKYINEWESPFGKEAEKFPLQAIGRHYMPRVHSTHDNNPMTMSAFPQQVFINKLDAEERKIQTGDLVRVWNDRGALVSRCKVSIKIMPGVIDIPQGAWYRPSEDGTDFGGNINVLTTERWTALAKGNPQHTIMVQVEKYRKG